MEFIAKGLEIFGTILSCSDALCPKFFIDEPEMPESMIEK